MRSKENRPERLDEDEWVALEDGDDLGALAGHTLQFAASLISQGAQIVTILQSDPFVLI